MGPDDESDSDPDLTPPPHNLGAGAERAWRHADKVEVRLREKFDAVAGELRGRVDELRSDLDQRVDTLDGRVSRQEANMQELRGQDGKGGIVESFKSAIADVVVVRRTMTTQAISLVVIVLGAAFVLYSRLATMEAKLELLTHPVTQVPMPVVVPMPQSPPPPHP